MNEILILEGARTPFATWVKGTKGDGQPGGALKEFDPFDLGAAALKGALARAKIAPEALDKVVFGNAYHVGAHAVYGGRYVTLRAGLPAEVPSLTVSLACGSGLQSFLSAVQEIAGGRGRLVAAVGADSSSLVRRDVFVPSFKDLACGKPIAQTAQDLMPGYGFSREDQDRWARHSHEAARRARAANLFSEEIVPLGGVLQDDAILENPSPEHFASSKPLYDEHGSATHANTHAIVDGGSALILAEAGAASGKPLGRYLGGAVVGLAPEKMAMASAHAIRKLLSDLRLKVSDIDLFEINETFASQMLIGMNELGLAEGKVNVNGGALALGHPFGGTGCRLVLTLLKELRRRRLKRGVASVCVGGGLGIAAAVEAV